MAGQGTTGSAAVSCVDAGQERDEAVDVRGRAGMHDVYVEGRDRGALGNCRMGVSD
jgi:hypothetical protein